MAAAAVLRSIVAKHEPNAVRRAVRFDFRNSFPSSFFARKTIRVRRGKLCKQSDIASANQIFSHTVLWQQKAGMVERKMINGLEYLFLTEKGRLRMKKAKATPLGGSNLREDLTE